MSHRHGAFSHHWELDPSVCFLNHGSFGACPRAVLEHQQRVRDRMEAEPARFFVRECEELLAFAREKVARFLGASADDLVFVPNATTGVNSVLRSLDFAPGDELLTTDQEYAASRDALDFVAAKTGATVVVAAVPFPLESPDQIVASVMDRVTGRTRLALLDHVTSQTGLVWPIERLVAELASRGVDTLVDAAHAPGMVPVRLEELGAAYTTANCHKWLCAPKGAAILHVRRDRRERIRPLAISHGATRPSDGRSRFRVEFDWTGTHDPTAYLCVPVAIEFLESLLPGGWPTLMERNSQLTRNARRLPCERLDIPLPCPDSMIGTLASIPIPDGDGTPPAPPHFTDPLQDKLLDAHGIEVPIICWPEPPRRLLRISCQLYNTLDDYRYLADALDEELPTRRS